MAYDLNQAIEDFDAYQLDEFGEPVTYTPYGGAAKTINVIRYHTERDDINLRGNAYGVGAIKIVILVSRDATNGIATVVKGKDTVTMRIEPDDASEKTLRVQYAQHEYGCWRMGLA